METKTLAQERRESFSNHARIARGLADLALAEIDEVLTGDFLKIGRETQPNQSVMDQAHYDRSKIDMAVIDSILSSSGVQL